ncbi:hypothetical protein KIP29_gp12 [Mycobacterium phage BabyRay]|uniref:Uncharacterized protein n=1 Tax=Mycobacterium phage BabyRay TaxID=1897486 RepID=A0A1D8EW39_9CAUD|nr:hypothetical protein KIP29_gp12 [Mycobacterium phage BabyRay]AOT25452.1 hypothetical protein SEA_BABYRAY_88 [Mycobacterium phage BabyRay]
MRNSYVYDQHYLMALDTLQSGGGTYTRDIFRTPKLPYRYYVALGEPHAAVVEASEGASALPHLVHELRRLSDERGIWSPERALGTWVDGGKVYVDIVESIGNRTKALEVADTRGQLAIWDSVEQVSIPVTADDVAVVA